jgi:hypothetical protein
MTDAPTFELLAWLSSRPRTYVETMEAWGTRCPRLTVWEDSILAGLVHIVGGRVELTRAGEAALARKGQPLPVVYPSEHFFPHRAGSPSSWRTT